MAMHLFEHNETSYKAVVRMLSKHGKAAVVHPTGTGKSFIGFKLCEDNPDKTILWLSPSKYIYQTQLENLAETSDGYQPENVTFYTYAKLMHTSAEEISDIQPDYIILDEFHRCGAELWSTGVKAVLSAYPEVPVLGLTATAIRYLDNQRDMTDELFDGNVASEMTLGEAIVRGILNPPKYILSVFSIQKDLEKYEKRVKSARYKSMREEATVYLDALRRSLEHAEKLDVLFDKHMEDRTGKYIVFCANREHMENMVSKAQEWFYRVDKKPHIYTAYSSDPETSKAFADFKADTSSHLKLLYCIDMLNEGVHVEDISGVILLRPTVSPIIYKQQIGRALSASKSKIPVIFDIVNNIENLYSIDTVKEEMQTAVHYYHTHEGEGTVVNDTFELIDKVADCKSLFEELEGTLSASWEAMYIKAKAYFDEFGDLEVPKDYYTEDGYSLGTWIATQRAVYRGTYSNKSYTLTQVQIDKLNSIGMRWEKIANTSWECFYEAAKKYAEKYGDLLPPYQYVNEDGIRLGSWICKQRTARKNGVTRWGLTEENIAKLDEIGMVWNIPDYLWEEGYASAVQYHKEHGDLNIPQKYVDKNGFRLGTWVKTQRDKYQKGKLSAEHIEKLKSIGFEFDLPDLWEINFQAAKAYFKEYGNLDIPKDYKEGGGNLRKWLIRQKQYANREGHSRLSEDKIEKLRSIGLFDEGSPEERIWMKRYKIAKAYYEEHGSLKLSKDCIIDGFNLHTWMYAQKKKRRSGELSQDRIDLLDAIGMKWENLNELENSRSYETGFQHLAEFIKDNDPNMIRASTVSSDGYRLGAWVMNNRSKYKRGELAGEYIERFHRLGYPLDSDEQWDYLYQEVKEYFEEHQTMTLPDKYYGKSGFCLTFWLGKQRRAYAKGELTEKQMRKMDEIGYPFKPEISYIAQANRRKWLAKYEIVKEYLDSHRDEKIDPEVEFKGIKIIEWIRQQRNFIQTGVFDDDRVDLFHALNWQAVLNNLISHWDIMYESAEAYFSKHGTVKNMETGHIVDGGELSSWIANEIKAINSKNGTARTSDQLEKLAKIGIIPRTMDRYEKQWLTRFEELKAFIDKHQCLPMTRKAKGAENNTAVWLNSQKKKFRQNKLTEKQIEMLRNLGIEL